MKHVGEAGKAGDRGAVAAVAREAILAERFGAPRFRYRMEIWKPRDENRALAIKLRDMRDDALGRGDHAAAATYQAQHVGLLRMTDEDEFTNQITTVGKNDLLDKYFAGSAYTAAWYMGLVDVDSFSAYAAGDTMASHAGWVESTEYTEANRLTVSFAAASAGAKATSVSCDFSINATTGIQGAFIVTNNTKGGTTGILYSAGTFSGGARTGLQNGDTLKVSGSWQV